jgi:hypothetical protein
LQDSTIKFVESSEERAKLLNTVGHSGKEQDKNNRKGGKESMRKSMLPHRRKETARFLRVMGRTIPDALASPVHRQLRQRLQDNQKPAGRPYSVQKKHARDCPSLPFSLSPFLSFFSFSLSLSLSLSQNFFDHPDWVNPSFFYFFSFYFLPLGCSGERGGTMTAEFVREQREVLATQQKLLKNMQQEHLPRSQVGHKEFFLFTSDRDARVHCFPQGLLLYLVLGDVNVTLPVLSDR